MTTLLHRIEKHHDVLAIFISGTSAFCFIASLVIALISLALARRNQKEAVARGIFNDYLKTAMQNPMFAYPPRFNQEYDLPNRLMGSGESGPKHFEEYEWFVSLLVFSMKEILEIFGKDFYWRETAKRQLGYQTDYFIWRRSLPDPDFVSLAGGQVKQLIDELIDERHPKPMLDFPEQNWLQKALRIKQPV